MPVKLVMGFPAGASPDLTARSLAEPLSMALGQPVIVENKVGTRGNIAAVWVAKATDRHCRVWRHVQDAGRKLPVAQKPSGFSASHKSGLCNVREKFKIEVIRLVNSGSYGLGSSPLPESATSYI